MSWDPEFERAFHPKSVAIVGVSKDVKRGELWIASGAGFLLALEQLGFKGKIYPVNPGVTDIIGYKAYPTVSAIPEKVDFVIVAVPAPLVPEVLEDCAKADAKNIHIFTAGFEETGEPQDKKLGETVREIIKKHSLRVIGPNCMGLYVPESNLGPFARLSPKSGNVSMVSQSGGHMNWFSHYGPDYGIYFNKNISYGNAYAMDSTDFLEYLASDPKTEIICMYMEGVKDGRKLLTQVKEINKKKPVIILKAGLTPIGARAVASHTASLAGSEAIWKAFFAQTGAVSVNTMEEMAEITMAFRCLKPPKGNRAAVISLGGGTSVAAADIASREGLDIPPLSKETQDTLRSFIPLAGFSLRNPLDTGFIFLDLGNLDRELEAVTADPNIDMVVLMPHMDIVKGHATTLIDYLSDAAKNHPSGKPIVLVPNSFVNDPWETQLRAKLKIELPNKGVAVFNSLTSASRALARFARYYQIKRV